MATKQATRDATISKSESLVLMKNMVRISISSICFIRDLFPRDCFKNKPYGNVNIHQLQGAKKEEDGEITVTHPDAFLLTQWLEQGVFHALEQEYLSGLIFAIFTKHPTTNQDILLETYEFRAAYQAEEGTAKINDVSLLSKDSVKNQAAKFIRALTEFAGTLDTLPDTCWITLQLKYYEHTPADYEPEYFQSSNGQVSALSERLPLVINIGNIRTPSVDMRLRYAGLESLLFEDLCKVGADGQCSPAAVSVGRDDASIFSGTNCSISEELQRMEVNGSSPFTTQNTPPVGAAGIDVVLSAPQLSIFDRVRDFILQGNAVSAKACACALQLPEKAVRDTFTALLTSGVIKRRGKGFQINPQAALQAPPVAVSLVHTHPSNANPHQTPSPQIVGGSSLGGGVNPGPPPPDAPRKSAAKLAYLLQQQSQESTEDIEDSFQDTTTSPHAAKPLLLVTGPQPLQLKRTRDDPAVVTGCSKAPAAAIQLENDGMSEQELNRTRGAQVRDAIGMSQESVLSGTEASYVASTRSLSSVGSNKRARKCSAIRDPIYVYDLHSVAKANLRADKCA